jgi:hypothetical protein
VLCEAPKERRRDVGVSYAGVNSYEGQDRLVRHSSKNDGGSSLSVAKCLIRPARLRLAATPDYTKVSSGFIGQPSQLSV